MTITSIKTSSRVRRRLHDLCEVIYDDSNNAKLTEAASISRVVEVDVVFAFGVVKRVKLC